jgi:hypothetical protein
VFASLLAALKASAWRLFAVKAGQGALFNGSGG